jgi:AI-2 transport protein TqsA
VDAASLERRIQTVCLLLLCAVALGAALYWLRPVMIPFVLALFLALGATPLVDLQVRSLRMPRGLAVATTLLLALLLASGVTILLVSSVRQLGAEAASYQEQLRHLIERLASVLPLEQLGVSAQDAADTLSDIPVSAVGSFLLGTTNAIMNTLSQSILVLIFVVYLISGGRAVGAGQLHGTWAQIEKRIERYLLWKAALSAATGILVGGTLTLLGIDLALVFGLFAFLLNFIPSVGSVIATLLPLPVVIVSPDVSLAVAVLAIAIPGVIQFSIGNVIEPRVMGESLDLHPITILMSLILWGMLWGIVGMLLATPITAVMRILFEKLEITRPVAALLAGRPGAVS